MQQSPFLIHREKVLGHYSTAAWLRQVVLALWSGSSDQVSLSRLATLDAGHFQAFADMTTHYHRHGENDPALAALVEDIQERQAEEAAANDRAARLERWEREAKACLRDIGKRPGDLDDHSNWFENAFDRGASPEDAAALWTGTTASV